MNSSNALTVADDQQRHIGVAERRQRVKLIVVDADPLADFQNLKRLSLVVKEGRPIDIGRLPIDPILTSNEARNPGAVRVK